MNLLTSLFENFNRLGKRFQAACDGFLGRVPIPYVKAMNSLRAMANVQSTDGNWNYDEYQFGIANGLILALHAFQRGAGNPPLLTRPPEGFIVDKKRREAIEKAAARLKAPGVSVRETETVPAFSGEAGEG
jgi:hypothetical protein